MGAVSYERGTGTCTPVLTLVSEVFCHAHCTVRTGSWMGPPQGERAPRVTHRSYLVHKNQVRPEQAAHAHTHTHTHTHTNTNTHTSTAFPAKSDEWLSPEISPVHLPAMTMSLLTEGPTLNAWHGWIAPDKEEGVARSSSYRVTSLISKSPPPRTKIGP